MKSNEEYLNKLREQLSDKLDKIKLKRREIKDKNEEIEQLKYVIALTSKRLEELEEIK